MRGLTGKSLALVLACALVFALALMSTPAMAASAYSWAAIRDGANGNGNSLTASDADHVWGVASNNPPTGTVIFWTANATAATPTWNEDTVATAYLSGIFALDNTHVWASGGNAGGTGDNTSAIYCWNGVGWDRQNNGGTAYQFNGGTALGTTQAWVCGNGEDGADDRGRIMWSNGGAYNSGTGGTAWVDDFVDPTTNGCPIKNMSSAGSSVWAVGYENGVNDGKIFKRVGPNNWTLQHTVPGSRLYGIKALDDSHAWASGRNGTVLYTTNGGTTWTASTTPTPPVDMPTITATDMNNAWAGGNNGTIWTWNGTSWGTNTVPLGTDGVKGSACSDANHVYMLTGSGVRNRVFRGTPTSIASCNPTWGAQGRTIDVAITGNSTSFVNGTSVAAFSGAGITVNSTTVIDATHATANITIAEGATPGPRDVNVTTDAEIPNPLVGGFTVRAVHTITTNAGPNGAITPAGPVKIVDGDDQAFAITPAAGYHTVDVAVDGIHLGAVANYTFENVTTDHVIEANFSDQYSTWYLAEGSTAWGLFTEINIQNPNDEDLNARITYMLSDGSTQEIVVGLPQFSKVSINPVDTIGQADFSTRVESVQGKTIAVDRTMMWQSGQGQAVGMHNSIGVTAPSTNWYLPEGSSQWGFETWLLIQNPNEIEASCDVTYMIEGVGPKVVNHKIPANTRATFNMADEIGPADASIQVTGNIGVIPERAMYTPWPNAGAGEFNKREGHDSIGTTRAATDFFLAEGSTAWGFTTYVLVQNPNRSAANVTLTFMTNDGALPDMDLQMPPQSRRTVRVNDTYPDKDLSTRVHADKPIIAERSMFWGIEGISGQATHDSIGTSAAHVTWLLPDGYVTNEDGGSETWTLVQNPNGTDVEIIVSYLLEGGGTPVQFVDTVPANSRKTYNMADACGADASASIMVECRTTGKKIIVERAMYSNGRWGGSDTIGGWTD